MFNYQTIKKYSFTFAAFGIAALALGGCGSKSDVRDRISIVGSSTVFPFSSVVAEQFAGSTGFPVPKVEATGTGGGMKIFCSGTGLGGVDITNASRRMKLTEWNDCHKNGVNEILEIKIGYDGIVLANSKSGPNMDISRKDLYLALAKEVPIDGKLVKNPYKLWSDVDPSLPKTKIEVMGPPPTSGTRDAFAELVLEKGAEDIPFLKALKKSDEEKFKSAATAIREDGAWKDMGENDNLIVQALASSSETFGVFGYSFYEENKDRIKAALIDGQEPELHKIMEGKYPASRSLYFYVKKANISLIPSIRDFIIEFTAPKAAGVNGYLVDRGLIPLKEDDLKQQANVAINSILMKPPEK